MSSTLVRVPTPARRGEIIEITAMAAHPMETGFRTGDDGRAVPRHILQELRCELDGELVFRMELSPAITAHPWVAFPMRVRRSGTLRFTWSDDRGQHLEARVPLEVSD